MSKYKNIYRIESNRLKGFDYSLPMWYYVTICVKDFKRSFASIYKGEMKLNNLGKVAHENWLSIPEHHENTELDEFVVMPNHMHGIVILNEHKCSDVQLNVATKENNYFSEISPKKGSLSVVIRTYKGSVKSWANKNGFENFQWQSNYFDHIIRNQEDLFRIRKYIKDNPLKWEIDKYYK